MVGNLFYDLKYIFNPSKCLACNILVNKDEKNICISCRHSISQVELLTNNSNLLDLVFFGRIKVEESAYLMLYRKDGKVQRLIHQLKYQNRQEVGTILADWFGPQLNESGRFQDVDVIVPVPLHPKKLRLRGYNQLTTFGRGLSKYLQVPFDEDVLIRTNHKASQTLKDRLNRWVNVKEIFDVKTLDKWHDAHILLIDDVVTTGATLESCALALRKIPNVKISILTMAKAHY